MSDLLPIRSSNLEGAKYDPTSKTLTVKFKGGGLYEYADVPPETFNKFAATFQSEESSGRFLHAHIKKFSVKKLTK